MNTSESINDIMLPSSKELESAVLGAILSETSAFNIIESKLSEEDFSVESNAIIFRHVLELSKKREPIDMLTILESLRNSGKLEEVGGPVYIMHLCDGIGSSAHIEFHALILKQKTVERKLIKLSFDCNKKIVDGEDIGDILFSQLKEIEKLQESLIGKQATLHISETLDKSIEAMYMRIANAANGIQTGVNTGLGLLNKKTNGWQRQNLIIIAARPAMGKSLLMDAKILTPTGWVLNKDIRIGDKVSSIDGLDSFVTGIYPQGIVDTYEVEFSDGRKIECCKDHLWEVDSSKFSNRTKVLTTSQIKEYLSKYRYQGRMSIPLFCGVFGEQKNFIIHPYLLGVLLGDGCLTKGLVWSKPDKFIVKKISNIGYKVKSIGKDTWRIIDEVKCEPLDIKFDEEAWKPIQGYEGIYEISSAGRIKSLSRKIWNGKVYIQYKERILKENYEPSTDLARVSLHKEGNASSFLVHKLVFDAFSEKDSNDGYIRHIGNKRDNSINNLYLSKSATGDGTYLDELKMLGLVGKTSDHKFIPKEYLTSERSQRIELLNGLLDTDGDIDKLGSICYNSVSKQLAKDVQELCWSLGYKCSIRERKAFLNGIPKQNSYRLVIVPQNPNECFSLPRKKERAKIRNNKPLTIISVKPKSKKECQCISVSHPRALYITDDYIVTHNTAFALHFAKSAAISGTPVAIFSLEMSDISLTNRLLLSESNVNPELFKSGKLSQDDIQSFESAAGTLWNLPIYIDDNSGASMGAIKAKAKILNQKGKCGMIVIDYLQLAKMSDGNKSRNREQEVAEMSREAKLMAKELDIPVLLLSQLSREVEKRTDKRPMLSDLRESGAIEQDADMVCFIHRPEYYGSKLSIKGADIDNGIEFIIAKNREGSTGCIVCQHNGSLSKIFDYDDGRYSNASPTPMREDIPIQDKDDLPF